MNDLIRFCRTLIKAILKPGIYDVRTNQLWFLLSLWHRFYLFIYLFSNIFLRSATGLPGNSCFERSKRLDTLKMWTCLNIRKNGLIFLGNKMRKSMWQMAGSIWDLGMSCKGHSEENKTHIQGEWNGPSLSLLPHPVSTIIQSQKITCYQSFITSYLLENSK